MKIANSYENCKRPRRNYTPKCENCKLIWKLQTDVTIANWYENCKAILTFWCIVSTWMFAIFLRDKAGMKTCSETERMCPFDCSVDDKNSTKWSLAKPSTLIPIPMRTQSDSYFKPWFLCSRCGRGHQDSYFVWQQRKMKHHLYLLPLSQGGSSGQGTDQWSQSKIWCEKFWKVAELSPVTHHNWSKESEGVCYMAPIWFPLIPYSIIDIHVFLVIIPFGCIYMNSSNSASIFLK